MSVDEDGNVSFDPDAGILGALKSALTLPGDVMAGRARVPQSSAMPGGESTENIGRVFEPPRQYRRLILGLRLVIEQSRVP